MICPKCGKEISEDSVFCSECGYKVDDRKTTLIEKKRTINKKFVIGIAVAIIVITGMGVGIYINSTPEVKYNKAEKAFENEDYERAIKYYAAAGDYKDAQDKLEEAELANHHANGIEMIENGNYQNAKVELKEAKGYGNSVELIKQCDYKIAEEYMENDDYVSAAVSFKEAGEYEDANDRILSMGQELVSAERYADAVEIYSYAKDWSTDAYAQYANGMVNFEAEKYSDAAKNFTKSGDVLDSKEWFNLAVYTYATEQLNSKRYSTARTEFIKISDYKDSAELINACDLMTAKEKMNDGNLNTAKEMLEKLPIEYSYNNVSVSELLDKLNTNDQWLAVCGKWTSTGGQMRSTQNGSYGYSYWWYRDFEEGDVSIDVRCKLNEDGSVTIVTSGSVPIYTNYSSISAGLKSSTQSVAINEKISAMGTVKINDLTSISFSPSKISVTYKKIDKSKDVYFSYTYKTDVTYGKRTAVY